DRLVRINVDFGTVKDPKKVLADLLWRRAHDREGFVRLGKGIYAILGDHPPKALEEPTSPAPKEETLTARILSVIRGEPGLSSGQVADRLGFESPAFPVERRIVQTIIGQSVKNEKVMRDPEGGLYVEDDA
ncbi:MAG: hypothetical protein ABI601_19745, partial [bacterium]